MQERDLTSPEELMIEIYCAIYTALESRLHLIGSVIDADSRKEILAQHLVKCHWFPPIDLWVACCFRRVHQLTHHSES